MAITVGSVEVDVIPNARGIQGRLRAALVPAATQIGDEAGRIIGRQIAAHITPAIRDGINAGARAARPAAARQGSDTAGAFSRALKTRLEAAFRALPKINIDANTSEADADLQALRVRMESLADKRIGIDIDAAAAKAEIQQIEAELTRLGARHPNVQVRADTATARAELAAVRAQIAAVDGRRINIDTDVDTTRATASILHLTVALAGLAVVPALPILAAGIGSIASAAVVASVGVGVLAAVAIPAFVGIAGALQAQKAAQDAAATATARGTQATAQGASQALQMASAQQALAAAERNGARQIAQAQAQVRQAKQAAADAVMQAAQRNAQAARAIEDAERALVRAQQDARRAQEDLTDARREARHELEDLNARLAGARLDERDAALQVKEAEQELAAARASGVRGLDLQRAQLAYDQAVQRLREQQTETKRLTSDTAEANRAGVEGSDTVRAAQDRLVQAQGQVADSARAVRDAQAEAARTQVETARQVAQAQERVGEATANVANAQQAAAESVASAQRQIQSASLAAAGGVDQAAVAQAKYQAELAKLSPAARGTFDAFMSLRTAFSAWSRSLQPAVMPIFTRALLGIKNSLPGLTPIVLAAARAITTLQDRASAGFRSPWWQEFKKDLTGSVEPAIIGMGASFGRVFRGMAGIVQAFMPHMDSISARMQRITGRFADWGTGLKGSQDFERFLRYSAEQAPILAEALSAVARAFYEVGKALSPLSGPVFEVIGAFARGLADIVRDLPWLVQLIYAVIIAWKLWTIAVWLFNVAWSLTGIPLIIAAVVALVAAVIYAWKNFDWFRTAMIAAWNGVKTAALWVWNTVLKPTFTAIWTALQTVGRWAMWLWNTILKPVFNAISVAARILATIIVTVVIGQIIVRFRVLAAIAMWLWNTVLKPVFQWIGAAGKWMWDNVLKPAFDALVAAFRAIGSAATWLWQSVISPVFGWIGGKASWLWSNAIKPAFDAIKAGVRFVADVVKWLWDTSVKPTFTWIGDKATWLWKNAIKPAFDAIKVGIKAVGDAFEDAKDFIGRAWDKVKDIAKGPVRFVIEKVYNAGVVPVWNLVANAFGAPTLKEMKIRGWATGGVLPGYTPGRDVHRFVSPTGGGLELSGGEAIMRPEWTRAVGSGFVSTMNRIASSRGSTGVKRALAPMLGGNPDVPTQRFADGGIWGWVKNTTAGVGTAVWEKVKEGASWVTDTLEASARAGVKNVVDPILASFPGAHTGFGKMIRRIPDKVIDSLFGYTKEADKRTGGGTGGPRIKAALNWARAQAGKPYIWGGTGPAGYDCSGFLGAIENVIRGITPPYRRRWATMAFNGRTAPPGWVLNGKSPFTIGITNAGVGHTAGTLGGVNVESRGGDGVVIGKRALGSQAAMFRDVYGFMPGKYDSGGYLPEGLSLVYNGTGSPEPVFTSGQASALARAAVGGGLQPGTPVTLVVQDGPTLRAYVDGRADGRVGAVLGPLATAIQGRRG
ncbi:hypothetical protein [Streptomyces sp. NPDC047315]|uniref:hypothetical protein n=1 Tax=Streptomyces sp. NPDC047315 TaxID=3155142 RepID=UPI0033E3ACC6